VRVVEGGLGDPQVEALLAHHRAEARATTPADNAHSLDSSGLAAPAIRFFSAWDGNLLLGIGALRQIDTMTGELKSMRTHPAHLRKGVSRAILDHIVMTARATGMAHLSLETGTAAMFEPANAMYARYGFVDCAPFAGYPPSPHNRFMTIDL
jgi:putative acetyltransferase